MFYLVLYLETCPPTWLLISDLHSQLAKQQMFSKLVQEFQLHFPPKHNCTKHKDNKKKRGKKRQKKEIQLKQ